MNKNVFFFSNSGFSSYFLLAQKVCKKGILANASALSQKILKI